MPVPNWAYRAGSGAIGIKVISGNIATATLGAAVSIGDRVVMLIDLHDSVANTVSSVTDSLGNTYNQDKTTNFGAGVVYGAIYSATVITAGTPVVTAHFTTLTSGAAVIGVSAYSGTARVLNAVDVSNSATGTTANASVATVAQTAVNQLVVEGYFDDGGGDPSVAAGKLYTQRAVLNNDASVEIVLGDKRAPQLNGQTAVTVNAADNWGIFCVVYKLYSPPTLPATNAELVNPFTTSMYGNVSTDDGDYFVERGSTYLIREYKNKHQNSTDNIKFTWKGRSTVSTLVSPILIQIYNVSSGLWETLANQTLVPADTDFQVTVSQSANVSNYYDASNVVTFRSYQLVV